MNARGLTPFTEPYDQCAVEFTTTVSAFLPTGEENVTHFINKLVIADANGGNSDWHTTYDSWDSDSRTIDVSVGDYPAADVKITIRKNNGDGYGLFISGKWTNFRPGNYQLPAAPFSEFYVPYPHVFVPKKK